MKPIEFEGSNVVLAKDQPEYQPLPVLTVGDPEGTVISCWELSDDDIETLRQTRKLWFSQLTFGQPLQPQLPQVEVPEAVWQATSTPPAQTTVRSNEELTDTTEDTIEDLMRMDCRVDTVHHNPMYLIDTLLVPALRIMLAHDQKTHHIAPAPGSVITILMSIDRTGAQDAPRIILQ